MTKLEDLSKTIVQKGVKTKIIQADFAKSTNFDLYNRILKEVGVDADLGILVNNVGFLEFGSEDKVSA
jgi:short-subunit dehydrogenase